MSKHNFLTKLGIFASIACFLSGCDKYDPHENVPDEIYGPPTEFFDDMDDDNSSEMEDVEDTDDFAPEYNEIECIYGPPEMFEEAFDPSDNYENEVYGPPPMEYMDGELDE